MSIRVPFEDHIPENVATEIAAGRFSGLCQYPEIWDAEKWASRPFTFLKKTIQADHPALFIAATNFSSPMPLPPHLTLPQPSGFLGVPVNMRRTRQTYNPRDRLTAVFNKAQASLSFHEVAGFNGDTAVYLCGLSKVPESISRNLPEIMCEFLNSMGGNSASMNKRDRTHIPPWVRDIAKRELAACKAFSL